MSAYTEDIPSILPTETNRADLYAAWNKATINAVLPNE